MPDLTPEQTERMVQEYYERQKSEQEQQDEYERMRQQEESEAKRLRENEQAKERMRRLRHQQKYEKLLERAKETGQIVEGEKCVIHPDEDALFDLQHVGQFKGLPNKISLCPVCAKKFNLEPIEKGDIKECVNTDYHMQNPKEENKATKQLKHGGVFGDVGPLPLCETCSSPFLLKMTPTSEESMKYKDIIPMFGAYMDKDQGKQAMLKVLVKVANQLDSKGLYEEAGIIDEIIYEVK